MHFTKLTIVSSPDLSTLCCDNCVRKRGGNEEEPLTENETELLLLLTRMKNRKPPPPPPVYSNDAKRRWKDRRKTVLDDLKAWRLEYWLEEFQPVIFPPETLLSDRMATTLAKNACIKTMDDLRTALPDWGWLDDLGPTVLSRIEATDTIWLANRAQEIEQRKQERKAKTEADRVQRAAEKAAKRLEEYGERDPPGTVLKYDPDQHNFLREDGTLQPRINEFGPETSTLAGCDDSYYLEAALVDSISEPVSQELVLLDTCSQLPLDDFPRPSLATKIKKSLASLLASRRPPPPPKPKKPRASKKNLKKKTAASKTTAKEPPASGAAGSSHSSSIQQRYNTRSRAAKEQQCNTSSSSSNDAILERIEDMPATAAPPKPRPKPRPRGKAAEAAKEPIINTTTPQPQADTAPLCNEEATPMNDDSQVHASTSASTAMTVTSTSTEGTSTSTSTTSASTSTGKRSRIAFRPPQTAPAARPPEDDVDQARAYKRIKFK